MGEAVGLRVQIADLGFGIWDFRKEAGLSEIGLSERVFRNKGITR
jgi:hypothetical protein